MSSLTVSPTEKPLKGILKIPGDKSISHRAVIFGSIAQGRTTVENLLEGEDVLCTVQIFRELGVNIQKTPTGKWIIEGRGLAGLQAPKSTLYCGNSCTTLRLMTGLLSGCPFSSSLTGDVSLNNRPMDRVIEPLQKMGTVIQERKSEQGRWIDIRGRARQALPLRGGTFKIPVSSAQLKTALLLAGLSSSEPVMVEEPIRSRDHSERMLKSFGASIKVKGNQVTLNASLSLKAQKIRIPGDISSAAFFLVAGLISCNPKSKIVLKNVGINPTRTGILTILKSMGGKIRIKNKRVICGEPVADLEVAPSKLRGIVFPKGIIPSLIDEIPILAVAAALAHGKTVIRGAEELRVKETDRIAALCQELPKFGIKVKELKDGLEIQGLGLARPKAAKGKSYGDHRMAMSLAVLGTVAEGKTSIDDTDCIATSFPSFVSLLQKIGASF